jgi:hypothetical protein
MGWRATAVAVDNKNWITEQDMVCMNPYRECGPGTCVFWQPHAGRAVPTVVVRCPDSERQARARWDAEHGAQAMAVGAGGEAFGFRSLESGQNR